MESPNSEPHATQPSRSHSTAEPLAQDSVLKIAEAAALVGTTPEAMRLRIKRGSLETVRVMGSRGRPVAGVRLADLRAAYPVPNKATQREPHGFVIEPHAPPSARQPATQPPSSKLEADLARERALREAERESNARAVAVIQDRKLAPVIEQLTRDSRAARRESRFVAVAALLIVGVVGWYSVDQITRASERTVEAQGQVLEALGQVGEARLALDREANLRADAERQAATAQEQLKAAETKLEAIALGSKIRAGIAKQIRAFR